MRKQKHHAALSKYNKKASKGENKKERYCHIFMYSQKMAPMRDCVTKLVTIGRLRHC